MSNVTLKQIVDALSTDPPGAVSGYSESELAAVRALALGSDPAKVDLGSIPAALLPAALELSVRQKQAALADFLSEHGDKTLMKAARRARYQLRSVGIEAPVKAPPREAVMPPPEEPLPSLLSAVTGNGERALIIARPVRGSLEAIQLVISDEQGVIHCTRYDVSRGAYRRQLKEIRSGKAAPAIEISRDEARDLLSDAVGLNLKSRTAFPAGVEDSLRHLGGVPREQSEPLPLPTEEDARVVRASHALHDEPELQPWLPPEPQIRVLSARVDEVVHSPLQLSDAQRAEQVLQVCRSTARAFFTPEIEQLYARRLWTMADFFERTGRPNPAALARAEARRMFHHVPEPSLFEEFLFEKILRLTEQVRRGEALPEPSAKPPPADPAERKSPGGIILP